MSIDREQIERLRNNVHPLTFVNFKAKDIRVRKCNASYGMYAVVNTSIRIHNAHQQYKTTYYGSRRAKWDMYNQQGYMCSRDTLLECKEYILDNQTHWIIERQHKIHYHGKFF